MKLPDHKSRSFASKTRPFLVLPLLAAFATGAHAQEEEVVTVPEASYGYLAESDSGEIEKQYFDLPTLANELAEFEVTFQPPSIISDDLLRQLRQGTFTKLLADSWDERGIPAAAAALIMSVTSIGASECAKLGKTIHGNPLLGSSSMTAVQNAKIFMTTDGLGRGQFDIRTTKFVLCRDVSNNAIQGVPITVRWIFNVNDDSLVSKKASVSGPITGPNGNQYQQNFHAEGIGIQLVLLVVNGVALPPSSPVYDIVENACIDIFFVNEVPSFDISVPSSTPYDGVFCAGGYCKGKPPGLDATQ